VVDEEGFGLRSCRGDKSGSESTQVSGHFPGSLGRVHTAIMLRFAD